MEIKINKDFINELVSKNIFTHWSFLESKNSESWLEKFDSIEIDSEMIIEGPSAFYCGEISNQKWQCVGGLCSIGAYSYTHSFLPSKVKIGRYSSIAKNVRVLDFSHPISWLSSSVAFFTPSPLVSKSALADYCDEKISDMDLSFQRKSFDPTMGEAYPKIGHDVWIGENVTLALGITVGHGSIVASNSTVTKSVPPYSIVAGVPAEVKKYRFEQTTIARLLDSKWWEYDVMEFGHLDYTDPNKFLDQFERLHLDKFLPEKMKFNKR
ncbi:CatB-related O-acetyltransferase [Colwelliaceae bacterium MEBiC 14330]